MSISRLTSAKPQKELLERLSQMPARGHCERSEAIHRQESEPAHESPRRQSRLATAKDSVFVKGALAKKPPSHLDQLRMKIRALEGHGFEHTKVQIIPFKDALLNAPLPQGGLALSALHEIYAKGLEAELASASTAFAACLTSQILLQTGGLALWAVNRADCYAPGLIQYGLDFSRIVWVKCRNDSEILGVMEEALHARALAAVLGEAGNVSLKAGRRLDAAARRSGAAAILLRRSIFQSTSPSILPSGAAATRWCVSSMTSSPLLCRHGKFPADEGGQEPGLGPPRWRLGLDYCRNGGTASWIVEASHDTDGTDRKAGHVRVVAELRDEARPVEHAATRRFERRFRAA